VVVPVAVAVPVAVFQSVVVAVLVSVTVFVAAGAALCFETVPSGTSVGLQAKNEETRASNAIFFMMISFFFSFVI
jgi:hypothetical protein